MESKSESRRFQKYEINGTGEPAVDGNDLTPLSKKKGFTIQKNFESDVTVDVSPYAISYPLANRLCALKNPRKFQQGMVGDRVMSAKFFKMKELESEMAVLKKQLHEVKAENKLLRALQHRQEHALKKFEDTKGQLPRLIQSHSEEVRALKAKCKKINSQNRDLEKRLHNREMELLAIQDQNRHLLQLSKDRNLGERESLRDEVDSLKNLLQHMELQFQEMVKRNNVELKINQQRLQQEINLNKELKKSLLSAEQTIHELKAVLEENEITFGIEKSKSQNQFKSPKEVKIQGTPSNRSSLVGQQNQQDAVEATKESSVKKISNERTKYCPLVEIKNKKSGFSPKDISTVEQKKSNQYDPILSEGGTENMHGRLSHINLKINVQESCFSSENFYLSLGANAQANNDTRLSQVNTSRDLLKNSAISSKANDVDNLTGVSSKIQHATTISSKDEVVDDVTEAPPKIHHVTTISSKYKEVDYLTQGSPKIHHVIKLGTNNDKGSGSADEDSSLPNSRGEKDQNEGKSTSDKTDITLNSDGTSVILCDEGRIKVNDSAVQHEVGIDRSKKEELLKALKAIDQEEWTDISETSDSIDTERELSVVCTQAKSERVVPHSSGKGKLNSGKNCSSGPSSAKSKKSPSKRNSAKPDLMHQLFGTIPKSEMKLIKNNVSEPSISTLRDILS